MATDVQSYVSRLLGLVGDDDPRSILSRTPSLLATLVAGADPATHALKPSPTRWSINEIVAHLADAELVVGYRVRQILANNGTSIQAYDQDRWATTFNYQSCDARVSVQLFAAYRLGTLRLFDRVAPDLFDNYGMHDERGRETVGHLIRLVAGHDRNHLEQVERIVGVPGGRKTFTTAPQRPEIPLDVVHQVDLRIGTIVDVADVSGADRLARLTVDFGGDRRVVVAGIKKERDDPRVLLGRQALFYYNLPQRTIRGEQSQAMLCDVGHADGLLPALLEPEWPVPNGTRAG